MRTIHRYEYNEKLHKKNATTHTIKVMCDNLTTMLVLCKSSLYCIVTTLARYGHTINLNVLISWSKGIFILLFYTWPELPTTLYISYRLSKINWFSSIMKLREVKINFNENIMIIRLVEILRFLSRSKD